MYIFVLMYLNLPKNPTLLMKLKRRDVGYILLTQKMFQQINVSKICKSIIF